MARERPVRSQALAILRELRDWTQEELADAAGLKRATICAYERGVEIPSDRKLLQFATVMGYTEEKVHEVLWLVRPPVRPQGRWVGPVYLSAAEEREIWDFGSDSSRLAAISLRGVLARGHAQAVVTQDREAALAMWDDLRAQSLLRTVVREKKEYQTWAVVELLCEESIRAAPSRPDRALELAEAAVVAAELAPGEEKWRLRVLGYAQAHVGNACKVINDFDRADEAFERADALCEAGAGGDPARLLNEGRLFGLKAALRTVQKRFGEALELLEQGLAISSKAEKPYLLISKAKTLEECKLYEGAIDALRKAARLIPAKNSRLLWTLRFDLLVNLHHLERYTEVEALLPEVQKLTVALGNNLDLLRLKWLEGLQLAGVGRLEESAEGLALVHVDFTALQLVYDAALVAMDLAGVLLQLHRPAQVKALARQMKPIFESHGIHANAKRALLLFREAALVETASVELVRSIATYLRRARRAPEMEFIGPDG